MHVHAKDAGGDLGDGVGAEAGAGAGVYGTGTIALEQGRSAEKEVKSE